MQPCQLCGGMVVDANGYCTQCGSYRGPIAAPPGSGPYPTPVSGTPYPPVSGTPYPPVSGTPYPPAGQPQYAYPPAAARGRNPNLALLITGGALVVLLVAAIIVVVVIRKSGGTATANPGGTTSHSTGSTPTTSPTPAALIDTCLIGSWTVTKDVETLDIPNVGPIDVTGHGAVVRIRPDGSITQDYGPASDYAGTANGHKLTIKVKGTVQGTIRTANDTISFSDLQADGTETAFVDNKQVGTPVPLTPDTTPVQYTCAGQTATQRGTSLNMTLTKTSDSPDG